MFMCLCAKPYCFRRSGVSTNLRTVLVMFGDGVSDRYCITDLSVTSWCAVSLPLAVSRHSVLGRSHGRVCRHRSRGTAPPGRRRGTTTTGLYVALFAAPPASIGGERDRRERLRTYVVLLLVQVVGGDQGVGVDAEQQLPLSSTPLLLSRPHATPAATSYPHLTPTLTHTPCTLCTHAPPSARLRHWHRLAKHG